MIHQPLPSTMEIAFSLGSNLGDRLSHLTEAKQQLLEVPGTVLLDQSPVYDTEPVGVNDTYKDLSFLNAVLVVESDLETDCWLTELDRIETNMGRVRREDRNAPRPIDIDILYAGDDCIESGNLTVPHPRWAQRRFVVQPLADVRPDLVLPGVQQTVQEVLDNLPEGEAVTPLDEAW